MKIEKIKLLKSVDFFSGAGGLSCGLRMAGFESLLGSDIHPVYADTFALNHPGTRVVTKDIRELGEQDMLDLTGLKPGELDLMAGGPPCQGFRAYGRMRRLVRSRVPRFSLEDFSARFISGPNLPAGSELDNKIREILGLKPAQ